MTPGEAARIQVPTITETMTISRRVVELPSLLLRTAQYNIMIYVLFLASI